MSTGGTGPGEGPEPDSLRVVTERFEGAGYTGRLVVGDGHVTCRSCGRERPIRELRVDDFDRFEGPSDPGDEAIVLAVRCPACDQRATLVSAFGPDADPALVELTLDLGRGGPPQGAGG